MSGAILKYTLPYVEMETKLFVKSKPNLLSLNSNAQRLAVIDYNGILNILEVIFFSFFFSKLIISFTIIKTIKLF